MKLFIQYVDTRVFHLYSAHTWASSYQNKSYQGQVHVSFDSRGFHTVSLTSAAMIHLPGSLPSARSGHPASSFCNPYSRLITDTPLHNDREISPASCLSTTNLITHQNDTFTFDLGITCVVPLQRNSGDTNMGKKTHTQRKDFSNKHAGFI